MRSTWSISSCANEKAKGVWVTLSASSIRAICSCSEGNAAKSKNVSCSPRWGCSVVLSCRSARSESSLRPVPSSCSSARPTSSGRWLSGSPSRRSASSVRASTAPVSGSPSRRSPSDGDTGSPTGSCCSTVPAGAPADTASASVRTCPGASSRSRSGSGSESNSPRSACNSGCSAWLSVLSACLLRLASRS